MSIYRRHRNAIHSDLDVRVLNRLHSDEARTVVALPRTPERAAAVDASALRKASPAEVLLPRTRRWLMTLPLSAKPEALLARFPRIANRIANAWSDSAACRAVFDDLLTDRRGGRRGFPDDVLSDLLWLRAYFESKHGPISYRRTDC